MCGQGKGWLHGARVPKGTSDVDQMVTESSLPRVRGMPARTSSTFLADADFRLV